MMRLKSGCSDAITKLTLHASVVLFLAAVGESAQAQSCPVVRISCPTTIAGTIQNIPVCNTLTSTGVLFRHFYSFDGKAGDAITIRLTSSSSFHAIQLLDSTGRSLAIGIPGVSVVLPASGTYTIILGDTTRDVPFSFTLSCGSAEPTRILTVVGSTSGSGGSFFRTALQLHNSDSAAVQGRIVYHSAGNSGSSSDPSYGYSLAPGETLLLGDLLPMIERSGIGSADLVATSGKMPVVVGRIFNDAGANGTAGMGIDPIKKEDALRAGDTGILLVPGDLTRSRFNIGVRTLDLGAQLRVTVKKPNGSVAGVMSRSYNSDYFVQTVGTDFTGIPLSGNEAIYVDVTAGSAIVYGSATDNKTQDPTLQYARRVE